MNAAATPTSATPADLPQEAAADRAQLDRRLARLDRLADIGVRIGDALAAQADKTGPQVVEGDVALAYDRVARAVRMATMLQSRLTADLRRAREAAAHNAWNGGASGPADPAAAKARKDQVARVIKRVADGDERLDPFQASWAAREARERLEHDDIYGQVMTQPVSDLVALICRDLGLNPDWERLAEETWAQDEMDSGAPGEPLAELLASLDEPDAASPAGGGGGEPCAGQRFGQHANAREERAGRSGGEGARQAPPIPTFHEHLQAIASDPAILAVAARGSG